MSDPYWTCKKIGRLNLSLLWFGARDRTRSFEAYFDWQGFNDPRHRRLIISACGYRPMFSERMGWKPMPVIRELGRLTFVYYKRKDRRGTH